MWTADIAVAPDIMFSGGSNRLKSVEASRFQTVEVAQDYCVTYLFALEDVLLI